MPAGTHGDDAAGVGFDVELQFANGMLPRMEALYRGAAHSPFGFASGTGAGGIGIIGGGASGGEYAFKPVM